MPAIDLTSVFVRLRQLFAGLSLSKAQSLVATATGVISIAGALYSFTNFLHPVTSSGDVVAIVRDATSHDPVSDATLEILTLQDALLASVTPDSSGYARRTLKEGSYKVRVSHPNYAVETRRVHITPKETLQLNVDLHTGTSLPLGAVKDSIGQGAKALGRKLGIGNQ